MAAEHGRGEIVVCECPDHADGLRQRERQREARRGPLIIGKAPSERGAIAGILAVAEESLERRRVDGDVSDPERLGTGAEEDAGALGAQRVVVLATGRDLLGVVGPGARRHLREARHAREAPETEVRTNGAAVSTTREL